MTLRDKTAVVGIGATPYYKRGESLPQTELELACKAILAALDDAGLTVRDLDGFAIYSSSCDPAQVASVLGVPEVRFAATLTSGGGGAAGSLGLAAAAITSGHAQVCVTLMTLQQAKRRLGGTAVGDGAPGLGSGSSPYGAGGVPNYAAFISGAGLVAPGHSFALLTRRHMELYGTKREHLAEVAISQRENAIRRPTALRRDPLTLDEYFNARMIADPLCLYDFTMESDGAVAAVVTSAERARDLRHPAVYIAGSAHGGMGRWGPAIFTYFQMPDEYFASSGHRPVAKRMYEMAGMGPQDVDVALLYDHFSSLVIMQLEAYIIGMTHIREAVEQLRGTAVNQVDGAEVALVTGGPAGLPVSGTLLRR
jgi:acetyl-CoA acetyltransferase